MPIIAYKYFTSWTIGHRKFPNLPVYADKLDNWTLCGFYCAAYITDSTIIYAQLHHKSVKLCGYHYGYFENSIHVNYVSYLQQDLYYNR